MKKTVFVALLVLVAFATPAWAQVSGETEVGSDNRGGSFASQYVFYDSPKANVLIRYFWVNNILSRGEFALGPTLKVGGTTLKLQFGGTTDKEAMTALLAVGKFAERQVLYIADGKWALGDTTSALYQKLFVAIDKKTVWQFRIESLHVGRELAFLRIGGEYQIQFHGGKQHIYIAPFYDSVVGSPGAQIGFRFF